MLFHFLFSLEFSASPVPRNADTSRGSPNRGMRGKPGLHRGGSGGHHGGPVNQHTATARPLSSDMDTRVVIDWAGVNPFERGGGKPPPRRGAPSMAGPPRPRGGRLPSAPGARGKRTYGRDTLAPSMDITVIIPASPGTELQAETPGGEIRKAKADENGNRSEERR